MRTSKRSFMGAAYPALAALLAAFAFTPQIDAASRAATLEAIHKLENPRNSPKPGRHGELGPYQFRAATWRMHTSLPFSQALDRETSNSIAIKHYEWIKRGLETAGLPATPYNIALAWNSGLKAVTSGRSPRVAHDYAQRAANLASVIDVDRARLIASLEPLSAATGAQ